MTRKSGLGFLGIAKRSSEHNGQAFNASLGQIVPSGEHPHLISQAEEVRKNRTPTQHNKGFEHRRDHRHSIEKSALGEILPPSPDISR